MSDQTPPEPGLIVLFGSGEISPTGRKVFEQIFQRLPASPRLALLETPAGFELNSAKVIGRVVSFFTHRLQNHSPQVQIIPARKRGTPFSPDEPNIVEPLLDADLIFMGPGSPTYAIRQLQNSLAWFYLLIRHRLGGSLALASAATVAFSKYALPVYEIYKVGEDLHWVEGLDFFGLYGLSLIFVPHWNNLEGGIELDTSRCFMGGERFVQLVEMLPEELTIVGLDEKTALIFDPPNCECKVSGVGKVTLLHTGHNHSHQDDKNTSGSHSIRITGTDEDLAGVVERRGGHIHQYQEGQKFPIRSLGQFQPFHPETCIPSSIWQKALQRISPPGLEAPCTPPDEVILLIQQREQARMNNLWTIADDLRIRIGNLGWEISDTKDGPVVKKTMRSQNNN